MSDKLCNQSLPAKGVNNGKSIGNGRKEHRQHSAVTHNFFQTAGQIGIMDRICQNKCKHGRYRRTASCRFQTVPDGFPEPFSGKHFHIVYPEFSCPVLKGF